jgi:hypothetical protein
MAHIAQMLHVSDFHFVEKLTQEGREWHTRLADLLRPKPHSFKRLEALAAKILLLEQQGGERKPFDLTLVTGDLTTNGAEGAFRTAWHYITSESIYMGSPGRLITNGLNAQHGRQLMIPGNHDRFARDWIPTQEPGNLFESILGTPNNYPYVVGYRRSGVANSRSEPALLFFVFDSTPSIISRMSPLKRIARGRIETAECRWLVDCTTRLRNDGNVPGLDGGQMIIDFERCIRIAVLHHHPFDANRMTMMENNEEFIEYCFKARIDLVLFGHDHRKYFDARWDMVDGEKRWIYFYCCPSASEYTSQNGFYTFDFGTQDCTFRSFDWSNGSFVERESESHTWAYAPRREIRVQVAAAT